VQQLHSVALVVAYHAAYGDALHACPLVTLRGFPMRSRLSELHDVLNMIAMVGTSDRPWAGRYL
jgi:hypothetical protein